MQIDKPLTSVESQELAQCEQVIENGLQAFFRVSEAFVIIHDKKLYRAQYGTFANYCLERWGFTDRYGRNLLAAARVMANLKSGTIVPKLPETESQARPLSGLEPEVQREAWNETVERANGEPITAAQVEEVAQEYEAINQEVVELKKPGDLLNPGREFADESGLIEAAKEEANKRPHVSHNSGDNEWYTPAAYIDAAQAVMGEIDLDPASCQVANEVVGAGLYFDIETDGLSQEWHGNIYLNPPYSSGLIDRFMAKLYEQREAENVRAAIVLVNNATETKWFQKIAAIGSAICFPKGRIKFWHPLKISAPLQGQAIVYLGESPEKFQEHFNQFGFTAIL